MRQVGEREEVVGQCASRSGRQRNDIGAGVGEGCALFAGDAASRVPSEQRLRAVSVGGRLAQWLGKKAPG